MDVVNPMLRLDRDGAIQFSTRLEFYTRINDIKKSDAVIFCRNTDPRYAPILDAIERWNIPYIYDLDDNLFEIPVDTPLGKYHRDPERLAFLIRYLSKADLVRVYSQPLLDRVGTITKSGKLVTPPFDWSLITSAADETRIRPVKIVYATSRKHDDLANIFLPALGQILKVYGKRVQIFFLGYLPDSLAGNPNVIYHPFQNNYNAFLRRFSSGGYDIGLAPLPDDTFYRAKTNNKFREYAACSIAGIYSDVEPYAGSVKNGETGILANNTTEDWYNAMCRLIDDSGLRQKISQSAKAFVQKHYSPDEFAATWQAQIHQVLLNRERFNESAGQISFPKNEATASPGNAARPLKMVSLAWQRLKENGFGSLLNTIGLQISNLWMLTMINYLKKL